MKFFEHLSVCCGRALLGGSLLLSLLVTITFSQEVSPPKLRISLQKSGQSEDLRLEWDGKNGLYYQVEESSDLQAWSEQGNLFTVGNDPVSVSVSAVNESRKFYRVKTKPAWEVFVLIPAGTFTMGDSFNEGGSHELPLHEVTLSAFYLQATETTNAQVAKVFNWAYDQGLVTVSQSTVRNATGDQQEVLDLDDPDCQISWDGSALVVDSGKENYPCIEITWYGSVAYCNYLSRTEWLTPAYDLSDWSCDITADGYRLPTEAEWEYAARGGLSGKRFPWGDTITHAEANYYSSSSYAYDESATTGYHPDWNTGTYPYTSPVGTFAVNGYGLYDMAGNLLEWCGDWFGSSYYSSSPASIPTGPDSGTVRVFRGGGWGSYAYDCRSALRHNNYPSGSNNIIGFRPARSSVP